MWAGPGAYPPATGYYSMPFTVSQSGFYSATITVQDQVGNTAQAYAGRISVYAAPSGLTANAVGNQVNLAWVAAQSGYPITGYTSSISVTPSITATGTCTSTISPTPTLTLTAIRKIDFREERVLAYPNPARGQIRFAWDEPGADTVSIHLYNLSGERIAALRVNSPSGSLVWDCAGVAPGIYLHQTVLTVQGHEQKLPVKKVAIIR
jgi:hypothetical protein